MSKGQREMETQNLNSLQALSCQQNLMQGSNSQTHPGAPGIFSLKKHATAKKKKKKKKKPLLITIVKRILDTISK